MPLNIDINFRWLSKKPSGPEKPKPAKEETKAEDSSSSSSSSSSKSKTKSIVTEPPKKKEEKPPVKEEKPPSKEKKKPVEEKPQENILRRLIIVRHGERMDRVFPDWQNQTTLMGFYRRYNANQPATIVDRIGGLSSFVNDPPITITGRMQAQLVGNALRKSEYEVSAIYCSPALRCVQTAASIYTELLKNESQEDLPKIRVEPALFDWMGWYTESPPLWMRSKELSEVGIAVDAFYKPVIPFDQLLLNRMENKQDFYRRSDKVIRRILASTTGAVLIVGHAATVDAGARCALTLPPAVPKTLVFDRLHDKYPYCSNVILEQFQDLTGKGQWRCSGLLPSITGMGETVKADINFLLRKKE